MILKEANHLMSNVSGFDILLRFFRLLVLRKRLVFFITLIPTVVCIFAVILATSKYKAQALIKPPTSRGFSPIEAALKESGGGLLSSVLGGSETGINDCMYILNSVRFQSQVIQKFDLETRYKFKRGGKPRKYFVADVIKRFQQNAKFSITHDEDAITISIEDESPKQAAEMVSYMVHALDSLYTEIQRTETNHRLEYVNLHLAMSEAEMMSVEDSLVAFQKRHNLLLPEAQVRILLENATQTELQVEKLKEDLDLEAALRGTSSARFRDLTIQKNLLQQTLQGQLRNRADSNTLMLPARTLPALANQYFRLERAYTIKLGVYKYLVQQVEGLKLEVDKKFQVISVIDPPWVNEKRTSPKRRVLVEAVFLLSFIFGMVLVVLQSVWQKHREENSETSELLSDIKNNLTKL